MADNDTTKQHMVLLYSQNDDSGGGGSGAAAYLSELGLEFTATEAPLREILLRPGPKCVVFEGADPDLVAFSRFCLQNCPSSVVVDPRSLSDVEYGLKQLDDRFEAWLLEKLRRPEYDVAHGVQILDIRAGDLVSAERLEELRAEPTLGTMDFNVTEYSGEELVIISAIFLEYACKRLGVEIAFDRLVYLGAVLRCCYGTVAYHSFQHVVDVAQYIYLMATNGLCYYNTEEPLSGFDSAALIVTAIGHDLLHPNVTTPTVIQANPEWCNKFSCLEEFHYSVFMSLLRPIVPELLVEGLPEKLHMLTAATEMKQHGVYVTRNTDCTTEETRDNYLCLLIKLADLCNCSRIFASSIRQSVLLGREINKEQRVRTWLSLSPGKHTATDTHQKLGGSHQTMWNRIRRDQLAFSDAFFLPILSKLSETPLDDSRNGKVFALIREQFSRTITAYSHKTPSPDIFPSHLFIE